MLGHRRATAPTLRGTVGVTPTQPAGPASPGHTTLSGNSSFATAFKPQSSRHPLLQPASQAVRQSRRLACQTRLAAKPTPAKALALTSMVNLFGVLGN